MLFIFFMVYFFIIIVNLLLYKALYRLELDQLIFNTAKNNLRTAISCISDHWFIVKRNSRFLDLQYLQRDNNYIRCEVTPLSSDLQESCGLTGKLNNRSEYCVIALLELLFSI
ncbi:IMV membrane protein involved in fusion and entry [Alphaentomopoxvirus acuprea]|uniref:IMV membrane protein involved in fusion and entry n=1 Tax=Alphaentomopoxvirus acuprea TaxID=62099 RepID=W6JKU0_9POXV|nr:IMV membrane protein involved in fusion and entry [Anomala cuprea entomopoxvirus]BAO49400.1 IMV membrane protein involved in fusion and entry [Anomala cuprea entomopoxvirus]